MTSSLTTERVYNISAITAAGSAVALGFIQPVTLLGYVAAPLCGAVGGFITGLIFQDRKEVYDRVYRHKYCRIAPCMEILPRGAAWEAACKRIQEHPAFPKFLELKGFSCAEEGMKFLTNNMAAGSCLGQSAALVKTVIKTKQVLTPGLLQTIEPQEVLFLQLLDDIMAPIERKKLSIAADLVNDIDADEDEYEELCLLQRKMEQENPGLGRAKISSDEISCFNSTTEFQNELHDLIQDADGRDLVGRINIDVFTETTNSTGETMRTYVEGGGHTFFFHRLSHGACYFYDCLNATGGLFKYSDEMTFIKALQERIYLQKKQTFGNNCVVDFQVFS